MHSRRLEDKTKQGSCVACINRRYRKNLFGLVKRTPLFVQYREDRCTRG